MLNSRIFSAVSTAQAVSSRDGTPNDLTIGRSVVHSRYGTGRDASSAGAPSLFRPFPYPNMGDPDTPAVWPDFASMVSHYVMRGRPTYQLASQPPNTGLVVLEAILVVGFVPISLFYFFLNPTIWGLDSDAAQGNVSSLVNEYLSATH